MIKRSIEEIGTYLVLLNGRYEYYKLNKCYENIQKGKNILKHVKELRQLLKSFICTNNEEIDVRSKLLSLTNNLIEIIKLEV